MADFTDTTSTFESSAVDAIYFDRNSNTLYVETPHGDTYGYTNVPFDIYEEFASAESVGSYWHRNFVNANTYGKLGRVYDSLHPVDRRPAAVAVEPEAVQEEYRVFYTVGYAETVPATSFDEAAEKVRNAVIATLGASEEAVVIKTVEKKIVKTYN